MWDENKSIGENEEIQLGPELTLFPQPAKVPDNSIPANPNEQMAVSPKVPFLPFLACEINC